MGTIASTDTELVEASRRGELDAFGKLVARYQDVVCAVSYSSTGDRALSEDVAQETFVAAWRRLDRVHAGALRPWLCAIARNLGRKARRRTRHEQPIEDAAHVAAGASPFDELVRTDAERIVRDALARVPEKYREVLVLYYQDNQSIRDVAETLGISEDAVTQRLSRGRRYLADGVTALVETSLRGARPRRDLVAAVLATVAAIVLPARVDAHPLKAKGSTMMKVALVASALAVVGTTAYLVRSHDSAPTTIARPVAAARSTAPLHYGTGTARRPALGPTAPVRPNVAHATSIDDLALLPADAELVLGIDVTRVQRSAMWQLLVAPALANAPGLHEFEADCGFDPIASLASVTVGMKGMDKHQTTSGSIVVHGFAKAKAFACIKKHSAKHDGGIELVIDGDVLLATSPDGTDHAALTFLDDTTALLVVGDDATKTGITRIAERRGAPAAGYSDMIHEINTDDAVWLAVADGSPLLADANRELAEHTSIQVHGFYGSIDFSDGLVINAGARTGSPELVAKLVADLQRKLDELVAHGEIAKHFEQLDINADGGDMIVSLAMNTSQLMSLASNATGHVSTEVSDHVAQHGGME
jgi:RNA polymerase sigma factor (sigma-70 family)